MKPRQREEKVWIMVAFVASLLFAIAFSGSLALIIAMLYDRRETILTALAGDHIPGSIRQEPVVIYGQRHRQRTVRRMAPSPSLAQIRRAAVA